MTVQELYIRYRTKNIYWEPTFTCDKNLQKSPDSIVAKIYSHELANECLS